jgi:type II secretory pathway pseudopilin PulG
MALIESIVVVLIVAGACAYAAWTLSPQSLRVRAGATAARWAAAERAMPRAVRGVLQRFAARQARRAPGCGGCKNAPRMHAHGDEHRSRIRRV